MALAFLIGDSICRGYAPWVEKELADRFGVRSVPENAFDSRNILRHIPRWLGDYQYEVIHINCGLHDVKRYESELGTRVSLEEYQQNLRDIVRILRHYTETVVWASTTPILGVQRKGDLTRTNDDVDAHNTAAQKIMDDLDVPVNDLHSVVQDEGPSRCISDDRVHMTETGYRLLGQHVASVVGTAAAST